MSNSPYQLQDCSQILQRELSASEKLLWSGQPLGGLRLRKQDAAMIPFSLMWGGFAIFWEIMAIHTQAPFFFKLWGIPFVLVGIYMIFGRFFVDAKQREKTFYGVTSGRIIIVSGIFTRQVRSLPLKTLSEFNLDERSDGSGTILFGPVFPMAQYASRSWPGAGKNSPPAFEMIERVRETYELIRRAQEEAGK